MKRWARTTTLAIAKTPRIIAASALPFMALAGTDHRLFDGSHAGILSPTSPKEVTECPVCAGMAQSGISQAGAGPAGR